jgi:hypothetical protein
MSLRGYPAKGGRAPAAYPTGGKPFPAVGKGTGAPFPYGCVAREAKKMQKSALRRRPFQHFLQKGPCPPCPLPTAGKGLNKRSAKKCRDAGA